jgi:APA family basic amino acid/polyamine antiporter
MKKNANQISLSTAVLMSMNVMAGVGIFAAPGFMSAQAGSISFLAWPITAILFLPTVLGIARISQLLPDGGGIHDYTTQMMGRVPGFLCGMFYYVGYTFATTTVLGIFRKELLTHFPQNQLIGSPAIYFTLLLGLIYLLNVLSIRVINAIQVPAIYLKFTPLFLAILMLPITLTVCDVNVDIADVAKLPNALTFAIFSFFGFEYAVNISRNLVDREKNTPRAIVMAFVGTAILYTLFHFGTVAMMGLENLVKYSANSFPDYLPLSALPTVKKAVAWTVSLAIRSLYLTSANGMVFGNVALLHGLSEQGLIRCSSYISQVNQFARPWIATLIQCLTILLLGASVTDVSTLASTTNFAVLIVLSLTMWALFRAASIKSLPQARALAVAGLVSAIGMLGYSWLKMGIDNAARLSAVTPLMIAIAFAMFLYQPKKEA